MSAKRKKLKIGVFGAGRGLTMITELLKSQEAELVAICDYYAPFEKRAKKLTDQAGTKLSFYHDFEKFINHDMDAVVLANYAHQHAPYAIRVLKSGRHVMSEVLACQTMAEAVKLIEAVEASGKIYTYAENYCYFRATQEMKRLYQAGDIGEFTHGEGEYVHDCASIWPRITYGEPNHWRNRMHATFYCTHSLGPVMTITGTRPVRVVGFQGPTSREMTDLGCRGGSHGMEVIQMSNNATVKSLHGNLKREPGAIWYAIYGHKGMMESDRFGQGVNRINIFREGDKETPFEKSYSPRFPVNQAAQGHNGGDFFTLYSFIEKILKRPFGEQAIDVYTAVDMTTTGLLAYRSICSGNMPIEVPDLRIRKNRDAYRQDNWCTDPSVAGKDVAPCTYPKEPVIPASAYKKVARKWQSIISEQ
jgi:predicted dehydrogenase